MTKRLRVIAGPNGSGKTSVYDALREIGHPNFGIFVNADKIEQTLKQTGSLDFRLFNLTIDNEDIKEAYLKFRVADSNGTNVDFQVKDNFLVLSNKTIGDSYFACFLAGFIRDKMLVSGIETFTIETVMSHSGKLDYMKKAKEYGYRVYLYYVTTDSPIVNIDRVAARVANGGHGVDPKKTINRYYRSLDLLFDAIRISDRAYLFDNSGRQYKFLAEYNGDSSTLKMQSKTFPKWLHTYVLAKAKTQE